MLGAVVVFSLGSEVVPWVRAHGVMGIIAFVVAFAVLGGFALVPTYANSLLAGWTFKFGIGFPVVMAGLGGAAMIGYFITHRITGHRVSAVIHEHPRWELVKDALLGGSTLRTIWIVTLLRLSPILPFETTTIILATLEVKPLPFLIGTLLGIAPRCAAIVFAGATAEKLDLAASGSRWLLVASLVATIIGAVVIALIAKRALHHATKRSVPA
jgi:uncharacterized membrane protein YdjX (TVP38/TMEM64 family)